MVKIDVKNRKGWHEQFEVKPEIREQTTKAAFEMVRLVRNQKRIRKHLENGGDIDDLDSNEFGFVQPI